MSASILRYKVTLLFVGIAFAVCYLVLPGYVFFPTLILSCIFILGLLKPEYTYYLIILLLVEEMVHFFIKASSLYEVRLYPYQIPVLVTLVGIMIRKALKKELTIQTPISGILLITVVYEVISILWAPNLPVAEWVSILAILNFLLFYTVINIVTSEGILRRSIKVWIFAGVIASTGIIISQWYDSSRIVYLTKSSGFKFAFEQLFTRPAGLAGSDHVAGFVSTAIFMALGSMVFVKGWKVKAGYLILILFMFYSMILTSSRGALLGLSGAYIFFILAHSHFKVNFLKNTLIFVLATIFIVLLAKPGFIDRMLIGFGYSGELYFSEKKSYSSAQEQAGLSGMDMRKKWWINGAKEMIRKPFKLIFGLGVSGFLYYSKDPDPSIGVSPEVNNIPLAFFYDMGIFGIILFIFLVYLLVSNLYYYLKRAQRGYCYYMLLASTAALIAETGIHGLVDYDLTSFGSKYFWFPLGFTVAIINILRKEDSSLKKLQEPHEVSGAGKKEGKGGL